MFSALALMQALLVVSSARGVDEVCFVHHTVQVERADRKLATDEFPAQWHRAPQASVPRQQTRADSSPTRSFWSLLQITLDVLNTTAYQDFDPFVKYGPDPRVLDGDDRIEYIWKHDVFPGKGHTWRSDGDEGLNFFKAAPPRDWIVLGVACTVLCLIDMSVLQRLPDTFKWHLGAILFWVLVAVAFNLGVWSRMGHQKACEWCSGYILEWMLSMDNLFVFHLIFKTYKTPANQIHKAVFVGVIGAVVMRLFFFMVVSTLLRLFRWVRFPFGMLLIWSGVEAAKGGDDDTEVKDTMLMRGLRWLFGARLSDNYDPEGASMVIRDGDGRLKATMLVVVICCLEFTDILFAVDSVSAKVAQIPDQYLAFSSSVIAMYGLRAMFFIVKDLVEAFDLLQYGLCLILIFIGIELMFAKYLHLASSTVCIMIVSVFIICIFGSTVKKKIQTSLEKKNKNSEVEAVTDEKPAK